MAICYDATLLPVATSNVKVNGPELVESFVSSSLDESSPSDPARTALIQASLKSAPSGAYESLHKQLGVVSLQAVCALLLQSADGCIQQGRNVLQ